MKKILYLSLLLFGVTVCRNVKEEPPALLQPEPNEQLSGGSFLTTNDFSENAFGQQAKGLSSDQNTDFSVGNFFFRSNWVTAPASVQTLDGLGVMFNAIGCGSCHFKDGRGEPLNGLLFRLSRQGAGTHGEPLEEPNYGGQFQEKAILGVNPEGKIQITYQEIAGQYPDGTSYSLRKPTYQFTNLNYGAFHPQVEFSPRIAPQIMGLGLLENIPESTLTALADESDSNQDGISGKLNYVWDSKNQRVSVGKFGWKANVPSLLVQTAGAFNGDMGITTSLFPNEGLSPAQVALYGNLPTGGAPEISDENLEKIVFYQQMLAVPARRDYEDQEVLKGKMLFQQAKCNSCHLPTLTTGTSSPFSQLNNQTIRPYTDLLLHDLGEGLADNRADFQANGREWRTPPLWGLGLIRTVNKHTFLLHDGRARNAEEAILWHAGEAEASKNYFKNMSKTDRNALLRFLESL